MAASHTVAYDFRVVDAEWPCERALAICDQIGATYIVVERRTGDGSTLRYVFGRFDLRARLARASRKSVHRALMLEGMNPSWTLPAGLSIDAGSSPVTNAPSDTAMRHGVVVEQGRAVGVLAPLQATRGGQVKGGLVHADPSPASGGVVERRLTGRLPAEVDAHASVSLLVGLTAQIGGSVVTDVFALPVGTQVDVVVSASDGLTVVGADCGTLIVADPQPDAPLLFKLRSSDDGVGHVTVYAFCNGVSIAAVRLATRIRTASPAAQVAATPEPAVVQTFALPTGPRPDLSIYIFEEGNALRFQLQSADGRVNMERYGPVQLGGNTQAWFRTFFADIEAMEARTVAERKALARKLASKGADLFDRLCPDAVKKELWALRGRISTIQITSEEPWIPWELCRLTQKGEDGRVEEGPFLAEFRITRWLYGVSAARSLPMKNVALVVPDDSGLDSSVPEKELLLSMNGNGRAVTDIEPTFIGVTDAMIEGRYDAWHFAGHASADPGVDADRSSIKLRAQETLSPSEVSGSVENALLTRPFVFLNACQSARGGLSLTGAGGWAQRLLKPNARQAAASAFIGSLWSVDDRSALDFSTAFYRAMLAGHPIGEAVRTARAHVREEALQRDDGDGTTWLAYTVYADPAATMTP